MKKLLCALLLVLFVGGVMGCSESTTTPKGNEPVADKK